MFGIRFHKHCKTLHNPLLPHHQLSKSLERCLQWENFIIMPLMFSTAPLSIRIRISLKMHGLKKSPKYLKEIIDLIHPDDIEYVMDAERMTIEKMHEIGWEHQQNLKCSYCFRMKTHKGNYEMFHHQSLHIAKDREGKLLQAVNIHTNIHHITHQNSYIVLVAGIGGRNDFHQMQYRKNNEIDSPPPYLTKREIEILSYLSKGNSAKQISDILDLSYHTVTTHRRNILHKTDCRKIPELVKKALEWGLI